MMESQLWRMEISHWEQSSTLLKICTWTCKRHTQACHLSHSEGRKFSTFINVAMTLYKYTMIMLYNHAVIAFISTLLN